MRFGAGAAAGCCFKMLLLEWCVRFGAGLLMPLQDAAASCCSRLLLSGWCVRFGAGLLVPLPPQGAASCWCRSVACALERGCWRRSRASLLWNLGAGAVAGARCEISMAV